MMRTLIRLSALGLVSAVLLTAGIARAQNADLTLVPADGQYDWGASFGSSAAVSDRVAVVGAPGYGADLSDSPPYIGLVNVYTTDAKHSAWTLTQVLHAGSATSDRYFGSGVALQGNRLIVAGDNSVWIYERGPEGFVLLNRFSASPVRSKEIIYQGDVLAFHQQLPNAPEVVVVYRITERGNARLVSTLAPPGASAGAGLSQVAFDPVTRTFAIGAGAVYFFAPRGDQWTYQETLDAPSTAASAGGFGSGVSFWGRKLVVGAPYEDFSYDPSFNVIVNSGAVHVYQREKNRWVQTQTISTADASSPVYGLVGFGSTLATNGHFVWITAPYANDQHYSVVQAGYSSLFRWNKSHLDIFVKAAGYTSGGGLDMSKRYVIEGFVYYALSASQTATIVDLRLLQGSLSPDATDGTDGNE